jgi:hypothetical protein
MVRLRALNRYKREYYHARRNGQSRTDASKQAYERVRKWMHEIFDKDKSLSVHDKREMWGDCLEVLVEWTALLDDDEAGAENPTVLAEKISALDSNEAAEQLKAKTDG